MVFAALFGEERMEKLMSSSIEQVKTLRANRQKSLGREPEMGEELRHNLVDTGFLGFHQLEAHLVTVELNVRNHC
jgi:hypothetical protein